MFEHHEAISKAKHKAKAATWQVRALLDGRPGDLQPLSIDQHLRMLDLQDDGAHERNAWLGLVARIDQFHPDRPDDWRYLAQAGPRFRVLLIGGDDATRIEERLQLARPVLPNKTLVAVINRCDARQVAHMLRSGADDVFRVGMDPLEARARLQGLLRREQMRSSARPAAPARKSFSQADRLASRYGLSQVEAEMLDVLVQRANELVPYADLRLEKAGYARNASLKSLAVRIHHLRWKVGEEWTIRNVRGRGYRLEAAAPSAGIY